jgi:hypothetical protein
MARSSLIARLASASVIAAALGCNAIAGINEPIDKPRDGNGVDAGGGGDGAGPPATNVSRFVGTWHTNAGTQELSDCNRAATVTTAEIEFLVKPGTTSDLVFVFGGAPACPFLLDVSGDTATLQADPAQTCTIVSGGETQAYSYSLLTFMLSGDGKQGELRILAGIDYDPPDDACVFAEISVYNKR